MASQCPGWLSGAALGEAATTTAVEVCGGTPSGRVAASAPFGTRTLVAWGSPGDGDGDGDDDDDADDGDADW